MAKQRDKVRMSPEEVTAFLDECKSMIVASLSSDGSPHQTVLWFGVGEDGTYLFETYGKSQKALNLRRDPRVSVLWEKGLKYSELRGVSVSGRAEIVDQGPRLSALMARIVKRNNPDLDDEHLAQHVEQMIQKRVVVVVHPEKTMSWDHRKLGM
jgi:PPOX class probable F420-dependent enzyme